MSTPAQYHSDPTFSFDECKKNKGLLELGDTGIKVLADEDISNQNYGAFKLKVFELPNDFAADFQSETKCIDRATTIRTVNHAMVTGNNWRFQMIRAEMCTRLSRDQCEFGLNPVDDEIREQSALASFTKFIKGNSILKQQNLSEYKTS